jgi:pimeloyl-ACP methyl ester carboxylesterase
MYLNEFATDLAPLDMTKSDEFTSLLASAADLGIPHSRDARYVSRHTVVRSLRFHFEEWGEPGKPEILLLHGGNQSAHSWDLVSLHLSDRYHVFALDQRGHGDSEWPRDQDSSIDARVADALAFLDDQGVDDPLIMGHSMGGRVTMGMALARPDLARGIVLVDVGPELSPQGTAVIGNFVSHNVEFDDLEEFLDNVVKYDRFRTREHIARTVRYNMLRRADGKYISKVDHRRLGTAYSEMTFEQATSISAPVLLVRGAESDVLEAEPARRFADALPKGTLVTVEKTGHNVHSGNTPGFLEAIGPFVASLDPA